MAFTYKYTLLKYSPDFVRQESVNIGLVVFLGESLDIRVLNNTSKLRVLGSDISPDELIEASKQLQVFVDLETDIQQQYESLRYLNSDFLISEQLGTIEIDHPSDYERVVTSIYNRLILPPNVLKAVPKKPSKFTSELKNYFNSHKLLGKDLSDINRHVMIPRFPIQEADNLYADYVLKNGSYHVTNILDYESGASVSKFHQSATVAITFDQSKIKFGEATKSYFIYNASVSKESEIQPHLNLVAEYADNVINFQSGSDFSSYIDELMKIATDNYQIAESEV